MAIDFPNSPGVNELFTSGNTTYQWDGGKWISLTTPVRFTHTDGGNFNTGGSGVSYSTTFDGGSF